MSTVAELGNLAKWYIKVPRSSKPFANQPTTANCTKIGAYSNSTSPSTKKKDIVASTPKRITYYCREHSE